MQALDKATEKPEGAVFLIPVRLQQCDVPIRLRPWQWLDLYEDRGYEKLTRALTQRRLDLRRSRRPSDPHYPSMGVSEPQCNTPDRRGDSGATANQTQVGTSDAGGPRLRRMYVIGFLILAVIVFSVIIVNSYLVSTNTPPKPDDRSRPIDNGRALELSEELALL